MLEGVADGLTIFGGRLLGGVMGPSIVYVGC